MMNLYESALKGFERKYGLKDKETQNRCLIESMTGVMQALKNMKCVDRRSFVKDLQDDWEEDEADILDWYEDIYSQLPTGVVKWGNISYDGDRLGIYGEGGIAALLSDGSIKIYDTATQGDQSRLVELEEGDLDNPKDFQIAIEDAKIALGIQRDPNKGRAEERHKGEQEKKRLYNIIKAELPDLDDYCYYQPGYAGEFSWLGGPILMHDLDALQADEIEVYLQHEGDPDWETYVREFTPPPYNADGVHSISDMRKIKDKYQKKTTPNRALFSFHDKRALRREYEKAKNNPIVVKHSIKEAAYKKCPHCELNYFDAEKQEYCDPCMQELGLMRQTNKVLSDEEKEQARFEKKTADLEAFTIHQPSSWYYDLGWLAANTKNISATMVASYEKWFRGFVGDVAKIRVVPNGAKTSGNNPMKYSITITLILKDGAEENMPASLSQFTNSAGRFGTAFVFYLIKEWGFQVGRTQDIADIKSTIPTNELPEFEEGLNS